MGGRGGYFSKYDSGMSSGNFDFLNDDFNDAENENFEEDKDTLKEYEGRTKILVNKNIHIKQSTDDIPEEIFVPNIDKINELTRKYLRTSKILKENNQELAVRADRLKDKTVAYFKSNPNDLTKMRIVLNQDIKFTTRKNLENIAQSSIDTGYWVNCDKEELVNQTITHEFGHYVQRVLMERDRNSYLGKKRYDEYQQKIKSATAPEQVKKIVYDYYNDYARKYLSSIDNIQYKKFNKRFNPKTDTSEYGQSNYCETFAETFAELNGNKNPNTLAKAMGILLNKKIKK